LIGRPDLAAGGARGRIAQEVRSGVQMREKIAKELRAF
jgi:hypothetical protein